MISQVMKLESAFMEYEKLGDPLLETIRAAVLLRCLTGQLKTWMQLQLGESTKYSDIREGVLSYERSTTKWSELKVLGDVLDTSAPMEVDRSQWNSKGKKKGKGKSGKGPKEKVSIQKVKMEKERIRARCGKGAGTNNSVTCFNCGKPGHKADNCWQPKQVRSLEQDNASSVGAGSNQQGC